MSRIGILGGSFNPPHKAHRAMAKAAIEQYNLSEVYFMPNAHPPHKPDKAYVSDEHRARMVRLVIESLKDGRFHFSDFEMARGGISYTCETLKRWKKERPEDELFFILGGDSLEAFDKWRKPEKIAKLATVLAAPRAGMREKELKKLCKKREKQFDGVFLPLKISREMAGISSTEIRDGIRSSDSDSEEVNGFGEKPSGLTSRTWRYIRLHGLYGCKPLSFNPVPSEKDLLRCLRATLRPKRLRHTLGVADTAEMLGNLYSDGDETMPLRARLAGLLHDCAKYYTDREQIALCDAYGITLTQTERENPSLIHGKLGAYLAQVRYGVKDEEILNAIRVHTVGKPDMTTLEKIIYIADYIEPGRVIPQALHPLEELRSQVAHDLDGTLVSVIENTIAYLKDNGRVIDEASLATLRAYER